MTRVLVAVAGVLALVVLVAVVGLLAGSWRWRRATAELDGEVTDSRDPSPSLPTGALPPAVSRYLARAIPDGARPIRLARLRQEGTFHMPGEGQGWKDFTAVEVFRVDDPAFYWDARIRIAPLLSVGVRDSYHGGRASMQARVGGLLSVADLTGGAGSGLAEGALARYLAEAVWMPTRLAVGPALTWRAVTDSSAEATLQDRGTSTTLLFTFDAQGDPTSVSGLRPMEVDGAFVDTPWIGRFTAHRMLDGYRIPTAGEVAWVIDGQERPYWRGTIVGADFTVR